MKLTLVTLSTKLELSSSTQLFVPVTAELVQTLKVFAAGCFNQIESSSDGIAIEDKELWKSLLSILAANGEVNFKF